jgi:hypothetical protein
MWPETPRQALRDHPGGELRTADWTFLKENVVLRATHTGQVLSCPLTSWLPNAPKLTFNPWPPAHLAWNSLPMPSSGLAKASSTSNSTKKNRCPVEHTLKVPALLCQCTYHRCGQITMAHQPPVPTGSAPLTSQEISQFCSLPSPQLRHFASQHSDIHHPSTPPHQVFVKC